MTNRDIRKVLAVVPLEVIRPLVLLGLRGRHVNLTFAVATRNRRSWQTKPGTEGRGRRGRTNEKAMSPVEGIVLYSARKEAKWIAYIVAGLSDR
jgi:hypothetical protein